MEKTIATANNSQELILLQSIFLLTMTIDHIKIDMGTKTYVERGNKLKYK
jgi:hypothetical protein